MKVDDVMKEIRWKEHDTDEVRFSGYDILAALNEVLRYVSPRLCNMQSDLMERAVDYMDESVDYAKDGAVLPDDFTSVKGIYRKDSHYRLHAASDDHLRPDTFQMYGDRLYVKARGFTLLYYGKLARARKGGAIDLPDTFFDTLVKLSRMVLNNTDVDTMTQAVTQELESIVPRRKWNNMRPKMPFFV